MMDEIRSIHLDFHPITCAACSSTDLINKKEQMFVYDHPLLMGDRSDNRI